MGEQRGLKASSKTLTARLGKVLADSGILVGQNGFSEVSSRGDSKSTCSSTL